MKCPIDNKKREREIQNECLFNLSLLREFKVSILFFFSLDLTKGMLVGCFAFGAENNWRNLIRMRELMTRILQIMYEYFRAPNTEKHFAHQFVVGKLSI